MAHKDLLVVEKGIKLAVDIYKATNTFPKSEIFGLTNQMRRAVVSISSNIAEGYYRTWKDFLYFIRVSKWSTSELITQITIAQNLWYISNVLSKNLINQSNEIIKMLHWFEKFIKKSTNS